MATADRWLTSLQLKQVKIAARVLCHARTITFQFAEVVVNFGKQLVDSLGNPPIQNQCRRKVKQVNKTGWGTKQSQCRTFREN